MEESLQMLLEFWEPIECHERTRFCFHSSRRVQWISSACFEWSCADYDQMVWNLTMRWYFQLPHLHGRSSGRTLNMLPSIDIRVCYLHRVRKTVRTLYRNIDRLVVDGMKIFVKSSSRIALFKNEAPYTTFPWTPVIYVVERGWLQFCSMQIIL
jgi:hypothetical protein